MNNEKALEARKAFERLIVGKYWERARKEYPFKADYDTNQESRDQRDKAYEASVKNREDDITIVRSYISRPSLEDAIEVVRVLIKETEEDTSTFHSGAEIAGMCEVLSALKARLPK